MSDKGRQMMELYHQLHRLYQKFEEIKLARRDIDSKYYDANVTNDYLGIVTGKYNGK